MKKSSKRLTITTQAKNDKGFRTRTAGIVLTDFKNNPLLLWMHQRPTGKTTDEPLPLGYWDDVKLEGDSLTGVPVFDDTDDFAMKIYNKVENGTIKMASAGLLPIEFKKENDELWLWDSSLFEASLVDIGSNKEALAVSLYGENMEPITLSAILPQKLQNPKIENMKIKLSAGQAKVLKLSEGHEMEASEAIGTLVTLANEQSAEIVTLTTAKNEAETKLAAAEKLANDAELIALVDKACEVEKKITADQKPIYLKMELKTAKELLATLPTNQSVAAQMQTEEKKPEEALLKMDWDELHKANKLIMLKADHLDVFKEKYKAKFGKDWTE